MLYIVRREERSIRGDPAQLENRSRHATFINSLQGLVGGFESISFPVRRGVEAAPNDWENGWRQRQACLLKFRERNEHVVSAYF